MRNKSITAISVVAFFAVMALIVTTSCGGQASDKSLSELDDIVSRRDEFRAAKEARIALVRDELSRAATPSERFEALGHLLEEYRTFNTDSATAIAMRREAVARLTGNDADTLSAKLNTADMLIRTAMYKEALDIIEPISSTDLPDYMRPYFFHLNRLVYGLLADYSVRDIDREHYARLTDAYRDSCLSVHDPNTLTYLIIKCDALNAQGRYAEAIDMAEKYGVENGMEPYQEAALAFTLANSYHGLGDRENEKRCLITSAKSDISAAIKEYISLRSLALMLYDEGDINHAYEYLKVCMDDAQECNARQRQLEINDIFQVVNEVYLHTIDSQQSELRRAFVAVCVMIIVLLAAIVLVAMQMRRVRKAKQAVEDMNGRLKELNDELKESNGKLTDANREITESSLIKEEYIARYMDQCLGYIDKLDTYRKSLNKLALAGRVDELKKQTKSVTFINSELAAFYADFDHTFLHLFPTFVDDFNALLRPEERIVPKTEGELNTELRIFALIRLGITDSVKIAKFLRYSTTTIYNYRTRVRNKAINRESLESQLMLIDRD